MFWVVLILLKGNRVKRGAESHLCGSTVAMDDIGVDTTQVVALSQGR